LKVIIYFQSETISLNKLNKIEKTPLKKSIIDDYNFKLTSYIPEIIFELSGYNKGGKRANFSVEHDCKLLSP
jgi:hypothetical protein